MLQQGRPMNFEKGSSAANDAGATGRQTPPVRWNFFPTCRENMRFRELKS